VGPTLMELARVCPPPIIDVALESVVLAALWSPAICLYVFRRMLREPSRAARTMHTLLTFLTAITAPFLGATILLVFVGLVETMVTLHQLFVWMITS
jgi:hypothetical protein